MKVLKTFAIAMLGSAALLPALPAWADAAKMEVAATDAAKPATPPLTVTAKPGDAGDQAMEKRRADHKAFMDARLAALQAGLQLTPAQQPLWGPVESALRDLAKTRHEMRHAMHEARDNTDPAARLKQRGERLVAMGQAIGKLADASGPLLGALTPDQKERLPMLLHGVGPRRLVKQAFGIEGHEGWGHEGWGHHGWGREGMRFGMHEGHGWRHDGEHHWGMRDGDGDWHHRHFADRDDRGDDRGSDSGGSDFGERGFDRHDGDRSGPDRDGGERHGHHGWDRAGRADRDGKSDRMGDRGDGRSDGGSEREGHRFDRQDGGPSRHFEHEGNAGDDERIGG